MHHLQSLASIGTLLVVSLPFASEVQADEKALGIFSDSVDVGECNLKGLTVYDDKQSTYTISGSGANMWNNVDAFQFVWTKATSWSPDSSEIAFVSYRLVHSP